MYLLRNGKVVLEDSVLEGYDLLIEDGIIKRIEKNIEVIDNNIQIIDAKGGYITPGLIDIHSDYIENMASPRPTSVMDFNIALRETEKVLVNTGITTIFHSLSLYGEDLFENKPIREEKNVRKLIDLISKTHNENHLIRHRFHARFEIDNINGVESLKEYISEGKVNLLSFMDHSPGQGQYRDLEVYKNTLKGYRAELEYNHIDEMVKDKLKQEKLTIDKVKEITEFAREKNIPIASHDDDTIGKVDLVKEFGVTISEFPITIDVAKYAKSKDMLTIAGAPNILLGGSHSGNLSAAEAILQNSIDILCSDYYPAAMVHSIFILNEKYGVDLNEAFKLVTINPAKAVKMDKEIGSIKENKRADILIINKINNLPTVTSVFVDGKLVSNIGFRI